MRNKNLSFKICNLFFCIFFVFVFYLIFPSQTSAATLVLSPSASKVSPSNIFTERIVVGTAGKSINNAEGLIQFPIDLLEVVSVNKGSSIFSLWVEEPSFSNYTGKITFNGGVPNPGYVGESGTVATITFKAKKAGVASIIFADGAVRENDGLGTDILSSKKGSVITIEGQEQDNITPVKPDVVAVVKNTTPDRPTVVSDTNPNQDIWYSSKTANFSWKIPNGVTSIQATLDKKTTSVPSTKYDNSVTQKTLSNIADGKSYFHIRFANAQGYGLITHYRVQIDSVPPKDFTPSVVEDGFKSVIVLNANDVTSGIDYYTVKIDKLPPVKIKNSSLVEGRYELPIQNQGEHSLVAVAYDKAGNSTEASLTFVSPEVSAPTISVIPEAIKQGDTITISGETKYPGEDVEIFTQSGKNTPVSYKKKTSEYGSFTVTTDPIKDSGSLSVYAQISFSDTVKGKSSDKVYVSVRGLVVSENVSKITSNLITVLPVIIIVLLILFILYFGLRKFFGLKKKINRELEDTIEDIHEIMSVFKDELNKQLKDLEEVKVDRKLNKKEQEIFKGIQNKIDDIDRFIEKRVKRFRK